MIKKAAILVFLVGLLTSCGRTDRKNAAAENDKERPEFFSPLKFF